MRRRPQSSTVLVVLLLSILASLVLPPASWAGGPPNPTYVDLSATGGNTGSTWEDAKTDLQDALAMAVAGVEIWVAEGTYKPGTVVTDSFVLKPGVELYGGFPAGGSAFGERNPSVHTTILSGDIGVADDDTDNCYHVVTGIDLDTSPEQAVLDGFKIQDGNAADDTIFQHTCGGGMYLSNSSPHLSNLTFEGNSAVNAGGGLFNYLSHPTLEFVEFRDNEAVYGGGLSNYSSDPSVADAKFYNNHASYGGGIDNYDSSPDLNRLYMQFNTATTTGGGIYNQSAAPIVDASYLQYNTAVADGGGMYSVDSAPTVTRSNFYRNDAAGWGGGMANLRSAVRLGDVGLTANTALYGGGFSCEFTHATEGYPELVGVTFEWNEGTNAGSTNGYGGGAYLHECDAVMTNVRFEGNQAALGGGGLAANNSSHPVVTNATFAANEAGYGGGLYVGWQSSAALLSSTVAGNVAHDATNGGGGILVLGQGQVWMDNTILWGCSAPTGASLKLDPNSTADVRYSVLEGGCVAGATCEQIITDDPQFIRMPNVSMDDNGDLRLNGASPAIDAGNTELLPADVHDLDEDGDSSELLPEDIAGNPRTYDRLDVTGAGGGHVDIGAFEAPPTMLYVDESSAGASTGLDWTNAFADLQTALVWGVSGPITVWVAEGTYTPGEQTYASFQLHSEMTVYGGFPAGGGSGDFGARDPDQFESVLSGDIGVIGESSDNVQSVVTSPGVDASAVLDGFTITGGNGGSGGGGWYIFYGDPTIRNVRFVRNSSASGGGMQNNHGSPTLTNVWFLGNVATEDGGGYLGYGTQSDATFTNAVFCGNIAQDRGGGFMSDTGEEVLVNVTFASNSATYGGGVAASGAHVRVDNAVFWGNGAAWGSQIWSQDLKVGVTYSLIAAGCPTSYAMCSGNIAVADPLFVRAPSPGGDGTFGTADDDYGSLNISASSPAADAGDNEAVPEDVHDLDEDGNVTEKLPFDVAGHPRFMNSPSAPDTGNGMGPLVDMGAYEALVGVYLPLILRSY